MPILLPLKGFFRKLLRFSLQKTSYKVNRVLNDLSNEIDLLIYLLADHIFS